MAETNELEKALRPAGKQSSNYPGSDIVSKRKEVSINEIFQ
jgi:hypothetical protein